MTAKSKADRSRGISDDEGPHAMALTTPASRILVIDDNPNVVDILHRCLREEGYGVLSALTSDEGLKLAILSRPELVLLDIALPGTNGIEPLKRIRSINPTTRVIMVTGNTDSALARGVLSDTSDDLMHELEAALRVLREAAV